MLPCYDDKELTHDFFSYLFDASLLNLFVKSSCSPDWLTMMLTLGSNNILQLAAVSSS